MNHYYIDTSVLLVYTLARSKEPEQAIHVHRLFEKLHAGQIKGVTLFYALHEVYLLALEHAPDFDIGNCYGKEALSMILATSITVVQLLSRIERTINARLFRKLPDASDLPHAISAKIWGCDGIIAYDDHFMAITDVLDIKTPEEIVRVLDIEEGSFATEG
jgi:predicted nucleic acid-binding protein